MGWRPPVVGVIGHVRGALRRARRAEDGQAVVELAFVLPILLILLLGIVDFGKAINYWNDENQIAETVARFAAVGTAPAWSNFPSTTNCTQPSDLPTLVTYEACIDAPELANSSHTTTGVQGSGVAVTACYPSNAIGQPITITVKANYNWLPLPKFGGPGLTSSTLTGSATMRIENTLGSWVPTSSC